MYSRAVALTLRVGKTTQKPGRTYKAGSPERIWAGWEVTPRAIAKKHGAHYL